MDYLDKPTDPGVNSQCRQGVSSSCRLTSIVVDTFHIFVRRQTAAHLDGIPVERIYLVQLSDLDHVQWSDLDHGVDRQRVIGTARHHRLLPGQGHFPIETVLRRLQDAGYAGPIGIEVFNDDLKAQDPRWVAREAMSALRQQVWPLEAVERHRQGEERGTTVV